jgi:hypothetical protein
MGHVQQWEKNVNVISSTTLEGYCFSQFGVVVLVSPQVCLCGVFLWSGCGVAYAFKKKYMIK